MASRSEIQEAARPPAELLERLWKGKAALHRHHAALRPPLLIVPEAQDDVAQVFHGSLLLRVAGLPVGVFAGWSRFE